MYNSEDNIEDNDGARKGGFAGYMEGTFYGKMTGGIVTLGLVLAYQTTGGFSLPTQVIVGTIGIGILAPMNFVIGSFIGGEEAAKFCTKLGSELHGTKTKEEIEIECKKAGARKGIEEGLKVALLTGIPIAASAVWSYYHPPKPPVEEEKSFWENLWTKPDDSIEETLEKETTSSNQVNVIKCRVADLTEEDIAGKVLDYEYEVVPNP